jgi:hypothetical protein
MAYALIDLSGLHYRNWERDTSPSDSPPVVLNPKASLHQCIAWCWGEISEAHHLAIQGQTGGDDAAWVVLGAAIQSRLMLVERVLEALCHRTQGGHGVAHESNGEVGHG